MINSKIFDEKNFDVVIVGAGLAGITVAIEILKKHPELKIIFIEKNQIGGMCRTVHSQGIAFDIGGHFFHNLDKLPALYSKFSNHCNTFNKNTYTIDVHDKLYHGMIQEFFPPKPAEKHDFSNLENYYISAFGKELYNIFLKAYNQKLNISSLKDCEPSLLTKARTPLKGQQSYNASFVYPKKGGCEAFINFLWNKIKSKVTIVYDEVVKFDEMAHCVFLKSSHVLKYKKFLFNSSSVIHHLGWEHLSSTVYVYNGVGKVTPSFEHLSQDPNWTYIANEKTPVFRLGNYQICGAKARGNCIPFYLESSSPLQKQDLQQFFTEYELSVCFVVRNAYPTLTKGIQTQVAHYIEKSTSNNLFWIGRYGKDQWFSMAETILDTKKLVENISWN